MNDSRSVYTEKMQKIKNLTEKYGLCTEKIEEDEKKIGQFKVVVPFIGGFSAGKSTLINTLIRRNLFSTEITPETAVPAELSYGKSSVIYYTKEGQLFGNIDEVSIQNPEGHHVDLISVTLEDEFLKQISNITIVDMPGFDSGCEVHNRAIDEYLPNSLAYMIAVSADEGTIRESILNFLHELKLNEMPVYIVITKADKSIPEELEEMIEHVRQILEYGLGLLNVKIVVTSSDENEVESLKEVLTELQEKSDELFKSAFSKRFCAHLTDLKTYLIRELHLKDSSLEELQEEKKLLEERIASFTGSMEEEKKLFIEQAKNCETMIQNKIETDLRDHSMMLENILIQGGSIQEKVNYIIRNAVTVVIRNQLEVKVRKYLKDISDLIETIGGLINDSAPLLDQRVIADNENMRSSLQEIVVPVSTIVTNVITGTMGTAIAGSLGIAASVLGPLGTAVGIVVGTFLGNAINKGMREREEEQKREAAEKQVHRMIQEIKISVMPQIRSSICEIIDKVIRETDSAAEEKIALQRKALIDLEEKMCCTEQQRQKREEEIVADLEQVELMLKEEGTCCNA